MRRRSKKNQEEQFPSLILSTEDGTHLLTFPADVVDPLRHLVARVTKNAVFPKRFALIAALRQEGVTYLSRALAVTLANDIEANICAVELNWWWPSPSPNNGGLASVIAGEASLDEVIIQTSLPNLTLLPAGTMPMENRAAVARSSMLQDIIEQLSEKYDHILLDIPAVLASSDSIPLASLGTAACLVVRQGVTSVEDVRSALDDVDHLSVAGVVMNQVNLKTPSFLLRLIPQN